MATYRRDLAGEAYVTRARFGPVGKDIARRTILVNIQARATTPVGAGRAPDQWQKGYPPGRLRKSIRSEMTTQDGYPVGVITADAVRPGETESYAASVHEGSDEHPILPRRANLLRWPTPGGGEVFSAGVMHPGTRRANPWMRNALEAARG